MATNKLLIQDINGNVGVNTTSPGASLDVWESQSNYILDLTNASEVAFKLRTYNHGTSNVNDVAFTQGLYYSTTENSAIKFYRGSSVTGGWMTFTTNNGTERLRIDSSGNVGIGTTNPGATLHVNASSGGIVRVSRLGTGAGILQLEADGTDGTITTTNNMKFVTNGEEQMRLDTSGNLFLNAFAGRGTTSTGYLFKLNPGKVYFELMANNTTSQSDILFSDGASGNYGILGYDHSNDSLRIYTNSTWNMTVDSQGRVGIGTTNPGGKLAVLQNTSNVTSSITTAYKSGGNSNLFSTGLIILAQANNSSSANTAAYIDFEVRNPALNGSHGTSGYIVLTHGSGTSYGNGQFDFYIRNNTPPYTFNNDSSATSDYWMSSVFTIKSDGKVGIGITEPSTKLHVRNDIVTVDTTTSGNLTGFYAKWHAADTGIRISYLPDSAECFIDSTYPITSGYVYGDINFRQNVAGTLTSRLYIKADGGNVGIGTTNPSNKLTIVGKFESRGLATDPNYAAFLSGIYDSAHALQLGVKINSGTESEVLGVYAEGGGVNPRTILNPTNGWNVGIGTTTPGTLHKLAVQGATRIKRLQKQVYNWYTTSGNLYVHVKTNLLLVSGQVGMWVWRLYGYSYGNAKIVDAYYGLHSDGSGNIYSGTIQNQGSVAFGSNMYRSTDNYLVLVGLMDNAYFFGFDVDVHHTMDYGYSDLSIISVAQSASSTGVF